ncbi:MAG TPA: hypothetical protein VNI84_21130 [Pyrinomonadaceae bacterium]|nr:hypothetical protein [Pyrinomonadaceae bacterium]
MAECSVSGEVSATRIYQLAFKIVAWKFLALRSRIGKKGSRYSECPDVCGQTGDAAKDFCSGCPIRKEDVRFERETLKELEKATGDKWKKYGFLQLQEAVINAMLLDDENRIDTWYVGTELLVNIFRIEKRKLERVEHENYVASLGAPANREKDGDK